MPKFPVDAPNQKVIKALNRLGFEMLREREHISMQRTNDDGSVIPLTTPNHGVIKSATLRVICTQSGHRPGRILGGLRAIMKSAL